MLLFRREQNLETRTEYQCFDVEIKSPRLPRCSETLPSIRCSEKEPSRGRTSEFRHHLQLASPVVTGLGFCSFINTDHGLMKLRLEFLRCHSVTSMTKLELPHQTRKQLRTVVPYVAEGAPTAQTDGQYMEQVCFASPPQRLQATCRQRRTCRIFLRTAKLVGLRSTTFTRSKIRLPHTTVYSSTFALDRSQASRHN